MFSTQSLISFLALSLGLVLQASAHAIITPALGVTGAAVRANVQRPSAAAECGTISIPSNFDSSTPAITDSDGLTFNVEITDFNGGVDGSRQIASAVVDPTGTGASFPITATVLQNGELAPTVVGSEPLVVQLPAGTVCSGGASVNKCLVSFTTAGKFGNCVVVEQSA